MIQLSQRELEIVRLAATGMTDKEVAVALSLSAHTVTTYWKRLRGKHNASSRLEIIASLINEVGSQTLRTADLQGHIEFPVEGDRLRLVAEAITDKLSIGTLVFDQSGELSYLNVAARDILNSIKEVEGMITPTIGSIIKHLASEADRRDEVIAQFDCAVMSRKASVETEIRLAHDRTLVVSLANVSSAQGFRGHMMLLEDTTSEHAKWTLAEMRESLLHLLVEEAPHGCVVTDSKGKILLHNQKVLRLLPSLAGQTQPTLWRVLTTICDAGILRRFAQRLATAEFAQTEFRSLATGRWIEVTARQSNNHVLLYLTDTTSDRRSERTFREVVRLGETVIRAAIPLVSSPSSQLCERLRTFIAEVTMKIGGDQAVLSRAGNDRMPHPYIIWAAGLRPLPPVLAVPPHSPAFSAWSARMASHQPILKDELLKILAPDESLAHFLDCHSMGDIVLIPLINDSYFLGSLQLSSATHFRELDNRGNQVLSLLGEYSEAALRRVLEP